MVSQKKGESSNMNCIPMHINLDKIINVFIIRKKRKEINGEYSQILAFLIKINPTFLPYKNESSTVGKQ